MRPIQLTLTAFGPYRDQEKIDFRELGDHRLFVISGNTGAGKTTIFDAICFALYGSASGEDRAETRMLRSHFADEATHTSVELIFAVRDKQYRVFRQMKHRKGGNKSETGEKIELFELTDRGEVPAVDRFVIRDVDQRLAEIIGLTREQFSQIVMLPQGEFRKLLTSSTDNKEEILRKIFRTEIFERLEQLVGQQTKQVQEQLRSGQQAQTLLLHQIAEQLPLREGSELAQVYEQEQQNSYQVSQALEAELEHYEQQQQQLEQVKIEMAEQLSLARKAVQDAEQHNRKLAELLAKQAEYGQLQERADEIELLQEALVKGEKARFVEPYEQRCTRAQQQMREALQALEALSEHHQQLTDELAQAQQQLEQQQALEPRRAALQVELHELEGLAPLVKQLQQQLLRLAEADQQQQQLKRKLEASEAALQAVRARRQELQQLLLDSEQKAIQYAELQAQLKQIQKQGTAISQLVKEAAELQELARQEEGAELSRQQAYSALQELEQLWLEGQAGELALHLHDGQPCPVCGSQQHPHKAARMEHMPSKEQLEQAKAEHLKQLQEQQRIQAQQSAKLNMITAQLQQQERITDASGAAIAFEPYEHTEQLRAKLEYAQQLLREQWKQVKEQEQQLQAEVEQSKQHKEEQQRLEQQYEQLEQQHKQQLNEQQQMLIRHATISSTIEQLTERIPQALQQEEQLSVKLQQTKAEFNQLNESWKAAGDHYQQVANQHTTVKTQLESQQQQTARLQLELEESKTSYHQQLAEAGFERENDYIAAKLTAEQLQSYRATVEQHKERIVRLSSELELLEQAVVDRSYIELEPLQAELASWQSRFEAVIAEETQQKHFAAEIIRFMDRIKGTSNQLQQLEAKLSLLADLFSTMKGDNPLKLSFERYILIDYLEQILTMANLRLSKLSNGQFELRRSDRLETYGKQSGLGLDVYDAYTGQNRDVKTLSGGEKFNAALCLALGMADVIQAHQGGVSIEMMFIDEGFGSLDEESLQKSIQALVELQRAGRMIGVISHVQELKAALPACLEVNKSRDGYSYTSFVIK